MLFLLLQANKSYIQSTPSFGSQLSRGTINDALDAVVPAESGLLMARRENEYLYLLAGPHRQELRSGMSDVVGYNSRSSSTKRSTRAALG